MNGGATGGDLPNIVSLDAVRAPKRDPFWRSIDELEAIEKAEQVGRMAGLAFLLAYLAVLMLLAGFAWDWVRSLL